MKIKRCINPNEYGSLLYNYKERSAVSKVLKSKRIFRYSTTKYPFVKQFEKQVENKFNVNYCLGVINGTAGLVTALKGIGIKNGDKVLISAFTYISTALAVILCGGIPIPMEIDLLSGIDENDLLCEIQKGECKAVIITHLQGRCFNLAKTHALLKKNNIPLIEDACQGFGSHYDGVYAGTFGDVGVYSFQQFKQISCGEGGAIVTNNEEIYNTMRNYTDMGSVRGHFPNWNDLTCLVGENYRMTNISGAILFEQMKKFDKMIKSQHQKRRYIMQSVQNYVASIISSQCPNGDTGMNILLTINNPNDFSNIKMLAKEKYNIEARKMWSGMYFENELFRKQKLTDVDLKNYECTKTKMIIDKLIVLSIPPKLSHKNANKIINFIIELKQQKYIN